MQLKKNYRRVVVKVGGSLFVSPAAIDSLIEEISVLVKQKIEVIVVSSGAIACGMSMLGIKEKPKKLSRLQATAALGQNELMSIYRRGLSKRGLNCGQVLLTWEDFDDRRRYLNAKNTILSLIEMGVVPVINENDTVSVAEIKFGDNDKLSALVANLIEAELLIILTDVDGLLTADKRETVSLVPQINEEVRSLACGTNKNSCVGGMVTKLEAASMVTSADIPCIIANGFKKEILFSLLKQADVSGTLFLPHKIGLRARKRWIAFGTKAKGRVYVDKGAREALIKNNKSLLAVGVIGVEGKFEAGNIVAVLDDKNTEFARGRINYSADELKKIKGQKTKKEVIHRDDLAIICKNR